MKYRPDIDGLRAIAVLAVLLDHSKSPYFSGGFVGVDIFFVISGFLLTFITITDIEKQRFSLWRFYERRIRRIIPALVVVCSVATIASFLLLNSESVRHYVDSLVATLLFVANFYFYFESNYFAPSSELELLLHTWSLGVEEQFYIFFPVLFVFFYSRKKVVLAASIVMIASLILATSAGDKSAVFYLLPYRAWEFAVGSLIALNRHRIQRSEMRWRYAEFAAISGLALMAVSVVITPEGSSALYLILPVSGAALVLGYGDKSTVCRLVLANPLMIYIGSISYSLYLWHQPVFAIARERAIDNLIFVDYLPLLVLVFALSHLSYKLVETPFRNRQKMNLTKLTVAIAGLALPILLLGPILDAGITRSKLRFEGDLAKYMNFSVNSERAATWSALKEYKPTERSIKIAVAGNSHAKDMFNALRLSAANDSVEFIPLISIRECRVSGKDKLLSLALPRREALAASKACETLYEFLNPYLDEIDGVILAPLWDEYRVDSLSSVLAKINEYAIPVLVAGNTARFSNVPQTIRNLIMSGATDVATINDTVAHTRWDETEFNNKINRIAEHHRSLFLDRGSMVCPESVCDLTFAYGSMTLFDSGHWTLDGAKRFGPRIYQSDPMQEFLQRAHRYWLSKR